MIDLINLIPFGEQHFHKTFEWISEYELRQLFLMRGDPSWENHIAYCNHQISSHDKITYAIHIGNEHIGNCGLKNIIDQVEGELWIYIGPATSRGKGVGCTATRLLIEKGFCHLGLVSIYLHVADFNAAAIAMYKKFCFVEVPLREDSPDWSGRGCQILRMALERC